MQSFQPILFQQPNSTWARIAAIYDSTTGASYPILSGTPPVAVEFDQAETNLDGDTFSILFDGNISALPAPSPSDFIFTVDTVPAVISSVTVVTQNTLGFTLAVPVENGEALEVSYVGTSLLSLNGVPVAPFGPETVTNNVP